MAWNKKEEKKEDAKVVTFTPADYDTYRAGIKPYKDQYREGNLFTPFLQFMEEKRVIRADLREGSGFCISSPVEFTKWNDIRAKVEAYDDAKLKEILDSMPEEREAWRAKIAEIGKRARGIMRAS